MKKVLIFVFSAVIVGLIISGYFYKKVKEEINVKVISIFQTGVYATYDEALSFSDSKNKIFYDGKLYHVYDSLVSSDKAKEKMIDFYTNKNIDYYVKEKYVSLSLYNDIDKYSKLIELSDNKTIELINNAMLEKYGEDIL